MSNWSVDSRNSCSRSASAPPADFADPERAGDGTPHAFEPDPNAYWAEQARTLTGTRRSRRCSTTRTRRSTSGSPTARSTSSYNCLDRHVEAGRGDRVAFHWAARRASSATITYAELLRDVQRLANALKALGVGKGDVVGIYLPMIPEVVVAMLACARIGAPHNVVFGGFSPEAVRERMEVSDAKALITVDGARRKGKTAPVKAAVDAR